MVGTCKVKEKEVNDSLLICPGQLRNRVAIDLPRGRGEISFGRVTFEWDHHPLRNQKRSALPCPSSSYPFVQSGTFHHMMVRRPVFLACLGSVFHFSPRPLL